MSEHPEAVTAGEIIADVKTVLADIETVLVDVAPFEKYFPASVKTVLDDAAAVLKAVTGVIG